MPAAYVRSSRDANTPVHHLQQQRGARAEQQADDDRQHDVQRNLRKARQQRRNGGIQHRDVGLVQTAFEPDVRVTLHGCVIRAARTFDVARQHRELVALLAQLEHARLLAFQRLLELR